MLTLVLELSRVDMASLATAKSWSVSIVGAFDLLFWIRTVENERIVRHTFGPSNRFWSWDRHSIQGWIVWPGHEGQESPWWSRHEWCPSWFESGQSLWYSSSSEQASCHYDWWCCLALADPYNKWWCWQDTLVMGHDSLCKNEVGSKVEKF